MLHIKISIIDFILTATTSNSLHLRAASVSGLSRIMSASTSAACIATLVGLFLRLIPAAKGFGYHTQTTFVHTYLNTFVHMYMYILSLVWRSFYVAATSSTYDNVCNFRLPFAFGLSVWQPSELSLQGPCCLMFLAFVALSVRASPYTRNESWHLCSWRFVKTYPSRKFCIN